MDSYSFEESRDFTGSTSAVASHQILISDDGTRSFDFYSQNTSNTLTTANQPTDEINSVEAKRRLLEKLNHKILSEYEGARQSSLVLQQNYRATVERFLSFASENKQIFSKIVELHDLATKVAAKVGDVSPCMHLRLVVNISLLYVKAEEPASLTKLLIKHPYVALQAFEEAVQNLWRSQSVNSLPPPRLGVCGWLGRHHVTPRGLGSEMVNSLAAVEGVVNKCSSVYPKLAQSVYVGEPLFDTMNEEPKTVHIRNHYDLTDFDKTVKDSGNPPPSDPEGRIVHRQEIGLSSYRNYQTFVVQETPEDSSVGQMPRYVSVIVQDDLCNIVKCGDRVRVWGVYRANVGRADDNNSGIGKPYLVANYVTLKDKLSHKSTYEISKEDRKNFHLLSQRDDALHILTRSLAPSICGQEHVKRGILLQLAGGMESDEMSSHKVRGDIHVLLVGDPGCGKSQMLRYVMNLLPSTVSTTGRGSTGVGLTASVVVDSETGERRVEGGAMVMGDRRVVCIDEFDKMPFRDRVAIHEVMEQQTVTVAKAGIHTTLNARCTVLAAANPLYGCWSEDMDVSQQLNFERSLLSRFDLIFVVRDASTEAEDDRIAEAILRNLTQKSKALRPFHGVIRSGPQSCVIQPVEGDMNEVVMSNAECNGKLLGGEKSSPERRGRRRRGEDIFRTRADMTYIDVSGIEYDILETDFLRKYLHYCRNVFYKEKEAEGWKSHPEISDVATRSIVKLYADLREKAQEWEAKRKRLPQAVTPRTLEAIIRLSVAYARLRLSRWVSAGDVSAVGKLLNYTLFGEDVNLFEEGEEDGSEESEEEFRPRRRQQVEVKAMGQARPEALTDRGRQAAQSAPQQAEQPAEGQELAGASALLACLKNLDTGDGVDVQELYVELSKVKRMGRGEFEALLDQLNNSEPSPIVYSAEEHKVFSC